MIAFYAFVNTKSVNEVSFALTYITILLYNLEKVMKMYKISSDQVYWYMKLNKMKLTKSA